MDETQIIMDTGQMIKSLGFIEKFMLLGEWGSILFTIIFLVNWVKFQAMDLVYYLRMITDPDLQAVKNQKARFDVSPDGWEDCTNLAWTRKGMRIYIGSKKRIVSITNSGLNRKDLLVHTESVQEHELIERIKHELKQEK